MAQQPKSFNGKPKATVFPAGAFNGKPKATVFPTGVFNGKPKATVFPTGAGAFGLPLNETHAF